MISLYDCLHSIIDPILICYNDDYPTDLEAEQGHKVYPYCTIRMYNGIPNNEFSDKMLVYIDIWSNQHGISEVETYTDVIFKAVNKQRVTNSELFVKFDRNNLDRLNLVDEDINLQHRQLRFLATYYVLNQ